MEETGDLLEDSWFFGNLLHTKPKTISRCYSDLASSSCSPLHTHTCHHPHPHPPLSLTQEHVIKIEQKNSNFSSRKQPPITPISLTRTPSLPNSIKTQSFQMKNSDPDPRLMCSLVGSDQEYEIFKNEPKRSSFSSRNQWPVAPPSVTRTPSLPNSMKTQSFHMKKPNPVPSLTSCVVESDQEYALDKSELKSLSFSSRKPNPNHNLMPFVKESGQEDVSIKNGNKSSSFYSRKQRPVPPQRLARTPSLPNSIETQSFLMKKPDPYPNLAQTSSILTSIDGTDQEELEDQEIEFTLGRLIRQASMNFSETSNPQTSKATTENMRKQPVLDQEKVNDMRKMERNKSKNTKISGKNKTGGGAPTIPGGLIDKTSSEDMKAHIKFWARAVASNVRQECS